MTPELKKDLLAYAHELASRGPVVNSSHVTLRRLWDTYGREIVQDAIATMPEFEVPCRRPYSIGADPAGKVTLTIIDEPHAGQPVNPAVVPFVKSLEQPTPHWPAVIGKLLVTLQRSGFQLERTDNGTSTLLVTGTPRQRRQSIKTSVVYSDRSHVTVSVNGRSLWLCVDLSRKPCECVTDHSDDDLLQKAVQYFHHQFQ